MTAPDHRAVPLADMTAGILACWSDIPPAPPPEPLTVEDLHEVFEQMPEPPRARRLEVGAYVTAWLRAHTEHPPTSGAPSLGPILGIPVIERDDLAPGAWRLLDADGNEIERGTL